MKVYGLNTKFSFGKWEGWSLGEILNMDPSYINWCALALNHFSLSNDTVKKIEGDYNYKLTDEVKARLKEKLEIWEREQKIRNGRDQEHSHSDQNNWDNEFYNDNLDLDQQDPDWYDNM